MLAHPRVDRTTLLCPLCGSTRTVRDRMSHALHVCSACHLLFKDPATWLAPDAERARYALHDNRPDDPGYVTHLHRLADPVISLTPLGARGLDFGCGPSPVLGDILSASGRPTASYDPYFFPTDALLAERYDFVTCCEVLEHVREPLAVLRQLRGLLHRSGILAIMTGLRDDVQDPTTWWYLRDPTHICFYSRATFAWLGEHCQFDVAFPARDVILLHRFSLTTAR